LVEKNAVAPGDETFQRLFMDETTMSLHPPLRRCWMRRGQRKTIPAPGTPAYRQVFGALNWKPTKVSHLITTHKNTEAFIAFLEHLLLTC
jgi:hypothetical protein